MPEDLQHEYIKSVDCLKSPFEKLDAHRLSSSIYLSNNNPLAALEVMETTLSENSNLPEVHKEWKNLITHIKGGLVKHSILSEDSDTIIKVFEAMRELGEVEFTTLPSLIPHYLKLGETEKALSLIELLSKAAPNIPRLKDHIALYYGASPNKLPHSSPQATNPSADKLPRLAPHEIQEILEIQKQMDIFWYAEKWPEVLKEASKVIEKYGELNDITAPFYHSAAIALDFLEKWLEALPIFTELHYHYPHYLPFQNSFLLFWNRFGNYICRHISTYSREALTHYEEVFSTFYFTPFDILSRLAKLDIDAGDTKSIAIQRIKARFALLPNDPDHLLAMYSIAISTGDRDTEGTVKKRIQAIFEERPYDLRYAKVFRLFNLERK